MKRISYLEITRDTTSDELAVALCKLWAPRVRSVNYCCYDGGDGSSAQSILDELDAWNLRELICAIPSAHVFHKFIQSRLFPEVTLLVMRTESFGDAADLLEAIKSNFPKLLELVLIIDDSRIEPPSERLRASVRALVAQSSGFERFVLDFHEEEIPRERFTLQVLGMDYDANASLEGALQSLEKAVLEAFSLRMDQLHVALKTLWEVFYAESPDAFHFKDLCRRHYLLSGTSLVTRAVPTLSRLAALFGSIELGEDPNAGPVLEFLNEAVDALIDAEKRFDLGGEHLQKLIVLHCGFVLRASPSSGTDADQHISRAKARCKAAFARLLNPFTVLGHSDIDLEGFNAPLLSAAHAFHTCADWFDRKTLVAHPTVKWCDLNPEEMLGFVTHPICDLRVKFLDRSGKSLGTLALESLLPSSLAAEHWDTLLMLLRRACEVGISIADPLAAGDLFQEKMRCDLEGRTLFLTICKDITKIFSIGFAWSTPKWDATWLLQLRDILEEHKKIHAVSEEEYEKERVAIANAVWGSPLGNYYSAMTNLSSRWVEAAFQLSPTLPPRVFAFLDHPPLLEFDDWLAQRLVVVPSWAPLVSKYLKTGTANS